jgi:putative protein kinase ArgK-like GTPase of G3E family
VDLLKFAPRAFVIEFAGTPKAGKTTSVEAIRHFFSRQGFRVHVLVERASSLVGTRRSGMPEVWK